MLFRSTAQAKIDQDIWDYEYIDKKIPSEFVPLGAVVKVTGTGAEMNNGAVITHEEKQIKGAVWAAFANFAILDPSYTLSVPEKQAVSDAFDTMSHCMETYFGMPGSDNLSDRMNEAVMRSVIENIRAMLKDFNDVSVRSELAWASTQ